MLIVGQKCLLGLRGLAGLLRQEDREDVGKNSALRDGDSSKHLVQLLVIPDGQLKVARDDPGLLVVPGSVPSQLQDLGSEILDHSSEVDRGSTSNPGGEVSLAEMAVNP